MDNRRDLAFERLEDVMPEVERLLTGHETTKGWTLGQILRHLAISIRLSLIPATEPEGSPPDPDRDRTFEVRRRRFFRSGRFPEGVEVPDEVLLPPGDADERVQAASLRRGIERLLASEGPYASHPMLGPLTRQDWLEFHRIHCAHHLGFARVGRLGDADRS